MSTEILSAAIAREHDVIQMDYWTGAVFFAIDGTDWTVYCTPFWEGSTGIPIAAHDDETGETATVVVVEMPYGAKDLTVAENLTTFGALLPLIRRIARAIIAQHTADGGYDDWLQRTTDAQADQ